MKKLSLLFVSTFYTCVLTAGIIVIEGKYQKKNLYVQNATPMSGVGFCTYEVTINGETSIDEINSTAFEIDFEPYQIKPGTEITVRIKHKDGCTPKILNPEALRPKATFETEVINIGKTGLLKWTASNENGSLPFIIEQFRWNKWVKVGELAGKGNAGNNNYSFQTSAHSGENKFRVKQVGYAGQTKYSPQINYLPIVAELTFTISKDSKEMLLSGESLYEVYDAYGTVVKQGFGKNVNLANLPKGMYYLCFDNTTAEFKKK